MVIAYVLAQYNITPKRDIVDWGMIMSCVLAIDIFSYFIGYHSDRDVKKSD